MLSVPEWPNSGARSARRPPRVLDGGLKALRPDEQQAGLWLVRAGLELPAELGDVPCVPTTGLRHLTLERHGLRTGGEPSHDGQEAPLELAARGALRLPRAVVLLEAPGDVLGDARVVLRQDLVVVLADVGPADGKTVAAKRREGGNE